MPGRRDKTVDQTADASQGGTVNQVGRDQYVLTVQPPGNPAQRSLVTLPAAPNLLVGRKSETSELLELLDPAGTGPGTVVVSAVTGLAGVGKTATALHVAHAAVEKGWFPGGVLFADLRGYEPQSASSRPNVLSAWLRALGVRDADLPPTDTERTGLYHSLLADLARRRHGVLLIADNASSAEQVAGLIPPGQAHRLLVTSRDTLAQLPARLIDLDQLESDAASELLVKILTRARPRDPRPATESDTLLRLAKQCAGLPLGLEVAAQILVSDPGLRAADLAAELEDTRTQLDLSSSTVGLLARVATAFEASYRRLDPDAARAFRLVSLAPGPDISIEAARALLDTQSTRALLAHLASTSLLKEQPIGSGRWRMHELTREYAISLADQDDDTMAVDRVLDYYQRTAVAAFDHLKGLPSENATTQYSGGEDALAWFDSEVANLIDVVGLCALSTRRGRLAYELGAVMFEYLRGLRRFTDAVTIAEHALAGARAASAGDSAVEARALDNLGAALCDLHRFDEAISVHQQATAIFRETGDRHGEAAALDNLGIALREARRFAEAIDAHQRAVTISRETGDRQGEAGSLNNLGIALRDTRRFDEAISNYRRAGEIFRETGDRHSEAKTLDNLGVALQHVRRFSDAIATCRRAGAIFRETGDRHGEATALNNLGIALRDTRRSKEAIAVHRQSVGIYREVDDRHGEAGALNNLGVALRDGGRFKEVVTVHRQASEIYRETGNRHGEAMALTNLGSALQHVWGFDKAITLQDMWCLDEAIETLRAATNIFRETNDRQGESTASTNLGTALQKMRRFDEAIEALQHATNGYREIGDHHNEGLALTNLGIALRQVRQFDEAIEALQHANDIFRETSDRGRERTALRELKITMRRARVRRPLRSQR